MLPIPMSKRNKVHIVLGAGKVRMNSDEVNYMHANAYYGMMWYGKYEFLVNMYNDR